MRLGQLVIIYFAAAAPHGVAYLLQHRARRDARAALYAGACGAAVIWPAWLLLRAWRATRSGQAGATRQQRGSLDRAVRAAYDETVGALGRVEEALCGTGLIESEEVRFIFYSARECAGRFGGLALACADDGSGGEPTAREMELCRIAGRVGDDLLLAGRCFHRRNRARLAAHRERARADLASALASVCATVELLAPRAASESARDAASSALAEACAGAAGLFSLCGDDETGSRILRLLDEGSASGREPAARTRVQCAADARKGEMPCTTRAAHTAFANPPRPAATSTYTRG